MFVHEQARAGGERQEQQQQQISISFPVFGFGRRMSFGTNGGKKILILEVALKKNNYENVVVVLASAVALAVVEYFLMSISSICCTFLCPTLRFRAFAFRHQTCTDS